MIIYIGADHRGFQLKENIRAFLRQLGYAVEDLGAAMMDETDDYPKFAKAVANKLSLNHENDRGILICGAGVGMSIVANKFMYVRAALVSTPDQAFDSRSDDDANLLCLAADYLDLEMAKKIVFAWLQTAFSEDERFHRRLNEISAIEEEFCKSPQLGQVQDSS
jgi:ribose 5-phosphate isomerase B